MIPYRNQTDYELHRRTGAGNHAFFNAAAVVMSLAFVVMVMVDRIF